MQKAECKVMNDKLDFIHLRCIAQRIRQAL
jgi:hypothetical protein